MLTVWLTDLFNVIGVNVSLTVVKACVIRVIDRASMSKTKKDDRC